MSRLLRQLGITALYVTHDRREAELLADQIVYLSAGRVAAVRAVTPTSGGSCMNTVMTVKKGVVLAMALSAMMLSSAHALTVYTAGPGSLAKKPGQRF